MNGHPLNSPALRRIAEHQPISPWAQVIFAVVAGPLPGIAALFVASVWAIQDGTTPISSIVPMTIIALAGVVLWSDLQVCSESQCSVIRDLANADDPSGIFVRRWLVDKPVLTQTEYRLVADYLAETGRSLRH